MAFRRALPPLLLLGVALLASLAAEDGVWGAFTSREVNSGNTIVAADDFRAPTSSARVIGKAEGGIAGFIRPGGTYSLYAEVADTGDPASGVSTVTANLNSITSGQTAASLSAGSFSFDDVSYNRRGATLTAGSGLSNGTYSYTLALKDVAGNTRTESGYTVTVDGTAPSASNIQTTNKSGNIVGRPELGDTVVFTYSETIDPLVDVGTLSCVVRIDNNSSAAGGDDRLQVYDEDNADLLPLGSVDLGRTDYVSTSRTFGASGTASTVALSGGVVTVTLGTQSGAGTTAASTGTLVWSPTNELIDRAGNAVSTATRTESGTADKDF